MRSNHVITRPTQPEPVDDPSYPYRSIVRDPNRNAPYGRCEMWVIATVSPGRGEERLTTWLHTKTGRVVDIQPSVARTDRRVAVRFLCRWESHNLSNHTSDLNGVKGDISKAMGDCFIEFDNEEPKREAASCPDPYCPKAACGRSINRAYEFITTHNPDVLRDWTRKLKTV